MANVPPFTQNGTYVAFKLDRYGKVVAVTIDGITMDTDPPKQQYPCYIAAWWCSRRNKDKSYSIK